MLHIQIKEDKSNTNLSHYFDLTISEHSPNIGFHPAIQVGPMLKNIPINTNDVTNTPM